MNTRIVDLNRARQIAELNDHFRHWGICLLLADRPEHSLRLGRFVVTAGVAAFGPVYVRDILGKVGSFAAFNEDNDPCREHDFGVIDHAGCRVFWKIDYYDCTLTKGSQNPADPEQTVRVLTIMLPEEY